MKLILTALTLATSMTVFAQTPRIDQRQANQQNRISQGVASGQLTGNEAANLQQGQNRIANMKANAKADGKVSNQERVAIKQAQNVQNQKIHNKKHN